MTHCLSAVCRNFHCQRFILVSDWAEKHICILDRESPSTILSFFVDFCTTFLVVPGMPADKARL